MLTLGKLVSYLSTTNEMTYIVNISYVGDNNPASSVYRV